MLTEINIKIIISDKVVSDKQIFKIVKQLLTELIRSKSLLNKKGSKYFGQ